MISEKKLRLELSKYIYKKDLILKYYVKFTAQL